jgi:hypothetical protein
MAEKNKSTQSGSKSRRLKKEEILELTEEVLSAPDEEILELSDVADVSSTEDEEEMIELTDVADVSDEENEEIMDMSDFAGDSQIQDEELIELNDLAEETPTQDEEIVEFEDIADDIPSEGEEIMELKEAAEESHRQVESSGPASSLTNEAPPSKFKEPDPKSLDQETGLSLDFENQDEQIELTDLDNQITETGSGSDQDEEIVEETIELSDLDSEISITEAIQENVQEDISDAIELTDLDSETIDKELGDLAQDFKTEKLEDTVELKDLDNGVVTDSGGQIQEEEIPQESLEIPNLDKEPIDKDLNLDDESQAQVAAVEPIDAQELQGTEPIPDFNGVKVEKSIEIKDLDDETLADEEGPVQAGITPMESLELTDTDREIIDQELHLDLDDDSPVETRQTEKEPEIREQELSLDLDIEDPDDTVEIKEAQDKPPEKVETPEAETIVSKDQGNSITDADLEADYDKADKLAESLGMTLKTDMGDDENLTEMEETFDPYKTQDILEEIAQFDEVAPKPMHKMTDPISIKVQDPAAEEHLEIDSLEQTVEPKIDSVSPEQIELALERVITKLLSDKIEKLLVEVIERTVSNEIDRIKSILLNQISADD